MGHFSFLTQDTNRSCLIYAYSDNSRTYFLRDNLGRIWSESRYRGYGEFGRKEFFLLLAEMNGWDIQHPTLSDDELRELAMERYDDAADGRRDDAILWPNITEAKDGWTWVNARPQLCPHQGLEEDTP